jgi:hypothetical protein
MNSNFKKNCACRRTLATMNSNFQKNCACRRTLATMNSIFQFFWRLPAHFSYNDVIRMMMMMITDDSQKSRVPQSIVITGDSLISDGPATNLDWCPRRSEGMRASRLTATPPLRAAPRLRTAAPRNGISPHRYSNRTLFLRQ